MKKSFLVPLIGFALLFTSAQSAFAGECLSEMTSQNIKPGIVTTGARVRSVSCMEESTVLATLPVGTEVKVLGNAHGFWYIQTSSGLTGWVGEWLISTDATAIQKKTEEKKPEEKKVEEKTVKTESTLKERVKGYILLQVENNGEAWYVDPETSGRFYMKDGATAYEMMRAFGLGISSADFAKIDKDSALKNRLKGRIVLKVEEHGEAYYIHPKTGAVHYLKNGEEAYAIMRLHSLGITNKDLKQITEKTFKPVPYTEKKKEVSAEAASTDFSLSTVQEYWLAKVNALRAEKGLTQLVLDERLNDTALEYAEYMKATGASNHERADGSSMHQWIDAKELDFTTRYSEGGWKTNYFTENISWGVVKNDTASIKSMMNDTMKFFLSEASYNGAHYRSIYHPDWNSAGVNIALKDTGNGKYKAYLVIHYGSLNKAE